MYRIGFSEDIHPLVKGRKLVLGGVEIPFDLGCDGHSDGDVVIHTVAESILGALALGDLGTFFPDNDPKYKGIDSTLLLKEVVKLMVEKGYEINNIDIQVAISKPKLANYKQIMREKIATLLLTDIENVSVKAMSFNKVGPIGNNEAAMAQSSVLLRSK